QTLLLEQRKFVADRRGPAVELGIGSDRLRCDRLARAQVVLHHLAKDLLLPGGEHRSIVGPCLTADRPASYSSSSASALRMICLPSCSATVSISAWDPLSSRTVPLTTTSCSGTPMPRNCTESRLRCTGPPAASACARATCAIVHRPCRMRPGSPTALA